MQDKQAVIDDLVSTLQFVLDDLNTELDYECRLIICGTIAKHTGQDYLAILNKALQHA